MTELNPGQRFFVSDNQASERLLQVVTFAEAGMLEEVRVLLDCGGGVSLTPISIRAVGADGKPGDEQLTGTSATVLNREPETNDQLLPMTLPRPLPVRRGDRIAIDVYLGGYCRAATNPEKTYAGGALYLNEEEQPGAMVFQTLIAR